MSFLSIDAIWLVVFGWVSIPSLSGFFLMGVDKSRARYHERRIPELVLFEIAFIGGAF
jgi:uncharacterized membrane protein YsdA (DUF1294 family)